MVKQKTITILDKYLITRIVEEQREAGDKYPAQTARRLLLAQLGPRKRFTAAHNARKGRA